MAKFVRAKDLLRNRRPTLEGIGSYVQKRIYLEDLKETYSRDYLLKNGFCTAEEYDSTQVTTHQADERRSQAGIAEIMNKMVGAEGNAWSELGNKVVGAEGPRDSENPDERDRR